MVVTPRLEPHTKEGEERVLKVALAVALFIFLGADPVARWLDNRVFTNWMDTTLEIIPPDEQFGAPGIKYGAGANRDLRGRWTAYTALPSGTRLCEGSGNGSYSAGEATSEWVWDVWLGRDCPVPRIPSRLCVRYDVRTTHGAEQIIGPVCSDVYDPRIWPPE